MKKMIIGVALAVAGTANAGGLSALGGDSKFIQMFPPVPVTPAPANVGVKALGGGSVKTVTPAPAASGVKALGGGSVKASGAGLGGFGRGN